MRSIRRILVGVKYPSLKSQPTIVKAAQLAGGANATLELCHVLTDPLSGTAAAVEGFDSVQFRQEREATVREQLEYIAADLRSRSIPCEIALTWDFPTHDALIRRAVETGADLIVAGRHPEKHVAPWLLGYTDWELLRLAPVPVLLVKSGEPYQHPGILAAVDPTHANAKPAGADAEILDVAQAVCKALDGTLRAVHAFGVAPVVVDWKRSRDPQAVDRILKSIVEKALDQFTSVLKDAGLADVERHFVDGHPVDVIPEVAHRTGSAIVVMGALSRSGLQRLFIGNTAEKVLGKLDCDVLVVKPPGFAASRTDIPGLTQPSPGGQSSGSQP